MTNPAALPGSSAPPDPAVIRAEGVSATARADRCRELAVEIDRRRELLEWRIEPVRATHRSDIWDSATADDQRVALGRVIAPALARLGTELGVTAGMLRERADTLEARAGVLFATASELEVASLGEAVGESAGTD